MSNEPQTSDNMLNCQGLACPQPIILTKRALDKKPAELTVIVDNLAAKENIAKFATNSGYGVHIEKVDGLFRLKLLAQNAIREADASVPLKTDFEAPVVLLSRNTLGYGSEELGAILMKAFFVSLLELPRPPRVVMLINSGVFLAGDDSPVLSELQRLSQQGVAVMVCGTCLDYYALKGVLAVGSVTNMYSILSELAGLGRIISL